MKVIYSEQVIEFLSELIEILYGKDYFGFKDSAVKYVEELVNEIDTTITFKQKKPAPDYFSKYGEGLFYVIYKKSNHTQCYVFFHYEYEVYYVRYIGNNHNISRHF